MIKKLFDYLKLMYDKYKYAFYSAIFFTFISHVYFFTKRLGNEDDLNFISFASGTLSSGRWTKGSLFTGEMLVPMIKFVFAIVVITLVSVMICDMFNIKKKSSMIITSLILATFPSLAISFGYLFMVEIYLSALILAVLAVYIAIKFKFGFIFSGLLVAISLGNYQSYIGVASALSVLYLIKMILDKKDTKEILIMFLKLFIMGIIGVILYFVILNCFLNYYNISLSNYKGANSMGVPPISEWSSLLKRTYLHYIGYFLGYSFFKSSSKFVVFRIILALMSFVSLIGVIINKKLYKKKINVLLLVILIVLLPLAVNIVDFMAYKTDVSALNIYQFVLTYLFCIYVIENYCTLQNKNINNYICLVSIICFIGIGWQNYSITSSYYYKVEKFNQYTESLNARLLARIESTDGFDYSMPVMIVGEKDSDFYNQLFDVSQWSEIINYDQGLWGQFIGYADLYYFNSDTKIITYINNKLGVELVRATDEQKDLIYNSSEYKEMKVWPSSESAQIINGILVIKL